MRAKLEPQSPLWETCKDLTGQARWRPGTGSGLPLKRAVTWARYPNRFLLTEYARYERRFSRKITTKLFELTAVSAQNTETGLHELRRYTLIGGALFAAMESQIALPSELQEADKAALNRSYSFLLENDLFAPNGLDTFEVESIIQEARLDGVEAI